MLSFCRFLLQASNFIKNVILDNILPGDIYLKARELHFNSEVSRVCLLIKIVSKTDVSAYDIVQNLFPDKSKDFVININEYEIALVKEIQTHFRASSTHTVLSASVQRLQASRILQEALRRLSQLLRLQRYLTQTVQS